MDPYSEKAENTIRHHMIWSMGAGFIPLPLADLFSVSAIQLNLIRRLCKIYEVDFREEEGKAIITALTSSALAKLGARTMIKFIPVFGSLVGGVTMRSEERRVGKESVCGWGRAHYGGEFQQ